MTGEDEEARGGNVRVDLIRYRQDPRSPWPVEIVKVRAGACWLEKTLPSGEPYPLGPQERWAHTVEVYVSPTGRSVRVWIDGDEVPVGPGLKPRKKAKR